MKTFFPLLTIILEFLVVPDAFSRDRLYLISGRDRTVAMQPKSFGEFNHIKSMEKNSPAQKLMNAVSPINKSSDQFKKYRKIIASFSSPARQERLP
jgi:ACT domain-containing protein